MSSSAPIRDNAVIPTLFLIGVTALLIYFAIPRPYRDPRPPTPTPQPTEVAAVQATPEDHLLLMSSGLEQVSASSVQAGSRLFSTTCTACHGSDAKGILGLGKPLVDSGFVDSLNDDELVAFLHTGRSASDPANTTKVAMPAKGGNPSLTDDDLNAIVDYIRSLNGATVVQDVADSEATPIPTVRPFQAIDLGSLPGSSGSTSSETVNATATPQAAASASETPVISYGYQTQGETPTVAAPSEATPITAVVPSDATPTTAYNYQTGADTTNEPVTYPYESQATSEP
jgi:mono/diheme cytochrome c family protein